MTHQQRFLGIGLLLAAGAISGCSRGAEAAPPAAERVASAAAGADALAVASAASPAAPKAAVTNRKIIRQAELELELNAPSATQTAIERLAEQHGGYVVSAARDTDNGSQVVERISVVVRVPQAELTDVIAEVKRLGRGVGSERITSDDVTDEYVDLVARGTSQKQLEQQYLEILKRAVTVKDAMEVQKELAEVRTEIERMQGRQQLLEKESAFATLTVHLSTAVPRIAVSATTFGGTIQRAWSDALALSTDMITGGIRVIGVLLPVFVLLVLPSALALWLMLRVMRALGTRRERRREAALAEA